MKIPTIAAQIEFNKSGYWPVYATTVAYLHNTKSPKKPLDLSKQARYEKRTDEIKAYPRQH